MSYTLSSAPYAAARVYIADFLFLLHTSYPVYREALVLANRRDCAALDIYADAYTDNESPPRSVLKPAHLRRENNDKSYNIYIYLRAREPHLVQNKRRRVMCIYIVICECAAEHVCLCLNVMAVYFLKYIDVVYIGISAVCTRVV